MTISEKNKKTFLATAQEAALAAGDYLKQAFAQSKGVTYKGAVDLVTDSDKKSQDIIRDIIQKKFPSHSILGEESLDEQKDRDLLWLIDPIDGTTNFAHSLPLFCSSIGLMVEGQVQAGVVYIPMLDELFSVSRGNGAYLNGSPIRVSGEKDLGKSLLATGFPYDRRTSLENNVNHFNRFIVRCQGIRRMGAAAIDLCYTAAGRLDGYWELKLYPWDTAAGALMLEEAGGKVTNFEGEGFDHFKKACLASNGHIHQQMVDLLQS